MSSIERGKETMLTAMVGLGGDASRKDYMVKMETESGRYGTQSNIDPRFKPTGEADDRKAVSPLILFVIARNMSSSAICELIMI